jgi:Zn-dependent protease
VIGSSIRLFRIGGIEVGVHASWLVVFGLVTWSLATGFFPVAVPGAAPLELWVLGAVAAVLLFVSVLIHELAHSFVARARGLDARSITLFIFGGVSNLAGEAKEASTEFLVAVVGPLSSAAIAGVCFVLGSVVAEPRLGALLGYLLVVNLLLAAFNLIPGFPLDGGRVLRAILWGATNNVRRATEIASGVGQLVGIGLMAWGLLRLFEGDVLGGIWTAAIGWFLQNAASASVGQVVLEQRLRYVRVRDVMRDDRTAVPADATVEELIERYLLAGNRRAMPVAGDGRIVGMVTLGDLRDVPPEGRAATRVSEVMGGRDELVTVAPSTSVLEAAQRLATHELEQLPVLEDGQLAGTVSRADIVRQVEIREALGLDQRPGGRERFGLGQLRQRRGPAASFPERG